MYLGNVNVDLTTENIIQIKNEINVECKNLRKHVFEKNYIWNHGPCTCENSKYIGSISGDSVIMCDEIVEATKPVPIKTVLIIINKKR